MQRTTNPSPLAMTQPETKPTLNVVIAYEDFETGKHAKGTFDFLVHQLGSEFQFLNQMWKFDVLGIPKLRDMAAKDAAMADIIIISSQGQEPALEVKLWVESWLALGGHPLALVALFAGQDCADRESNPAREYLAEVARRGRLEFFAQPDEWPGRDASFLLNRAFRINKGAAPFMAGRAGHETHSRWGINE